MSTTDQWSSQALDDGGLLIPSRKDHWPNIDQRLDTEQMAGMAPALDPQEVEAELAVLRANVAKLSRTKEGGQAGGTPGPSVPAVQPEARHIATSVINELDRLGWMEAKSELEEAVRDVARSPSPDVTGVITHCCGALEAVARTVSGKGQNLGPLLKDHYAKLGLDKLSAELAYKQVWKVGSAKARHIQPGEYPSEKEARQALWSTLSALENASLSQVDRAYTCW